MTTFSPTWSARAAGAFRGLAARPGTLFLLLLALNALARPYADLTHDAQMYGVQVLNQVEHGAYADDLFFRYGSQDQFSVFSRLAAPLVGAFGVRPTFFALYLVFNTLFVWALLRFVYALLGVRVAAAGSLVYLVVSYVPFGGHDIFYVHEYFFTPRLAANALVLLGLERSLRGRQWTALALLGGALLLHPLMAFGGVLIWAAFLAASHLSTRTFVAAGVAATVAGVVVLLTPPLATRLFGHMDDDWRELVFACTAYNYPLDWAWNDWLNQAVCFLVLPPAAVLIFRDDPPRRRFLLALGLAGAVGLLGTLVGSLLPYALLFQGQPYRVMWILKVVQVAVGIELALRLCRRPDAVSQWAGLGLIAFFGTTSFLTPELLLPLLALPVFAFAFWARAEGRPWAWNAALASVATGALVWAGFKVGLVLVRCPDPAAGFAPHEVVRLALYQLGPVTVLVGLALLLAKARLLSLDNRRLAWGCVGVALAVQTAFFVPAQLPAYRDRYTPFGPDLAFLRDHLAQRRGPDAPLPTVYSGVRAGYRLWVEIPAKNYFDWNQVAGVLFNRETGVEARRRALLVRPFEFARYRTETIKTPTGQRAVQQLFQCDGVCPAPTVDDLAKLCAESGLDYVLLPQGFPGLYAATNGSIYVYECPQVRAALRLPEPSTALAAATPTAAPRTP